MILQSHQMKQGDVKIADEMDALGSLSSDSVRGTDNGFFPEATTGKHRRTALHVIGIFPVIRKTFLFPRRVDLLSKKRLRSPEFCRRQVDPQA